MLTIYRSNNTGYLVEFNGKAIKYINVNELRRLIKLNDARKIDKIKIVLKF